MSETGQDHGTLPQPTVAALLRLAFQAQQRGKHSEARKLLRGLVARQPNDPRVWLMLATLADTRDEQRQMLEQVLEIDPAHPLALRGLAELRRTAPSAPQPAQPAIRLRPAHAAPPLTEPVKLGGPAPAAAPPVAAPPRRWMGVLLPGAVVALAAAFGLALVRGTSVGPPPTPTASLPGAVVIVPSLAAPTASLPPLPTAAPPSATPQASPTAAPTAVIGRMITRGIWNVGLLRPGDVVVIDGEIGGLKPSGRFVLALVAVSNSGNASARIPPELVTLVDGAGNQYTPLSGASSLYLDSFGRGRGDLSFEAPVPPGGGNVSVPLIFDAPPGARDLRLSIADGALSWPLDRLPGTGVRPSPAP